ncbi:uncharacterized protein LOC123009977 [Tribolium madens]|uniref:uncharacterized protein LOC123009977 n=1 Tax=Tribolium madens TaxID=41895 RepID=UPI001CF74941|nr:uncharacterized protein LOC123009977 [Tribolium madens]
MIFSIIMEKRIFEMNNLLETVSWPISFGGKGIKVEINKRYLFTNMVLYGFGALLPFSMIILLPIFGDLKEWWLSCRMSVDYFGDWSGIVDLFFFCTGPMVAFTELRQPALLLYGILKIDLQIFLLNKQIVQLSHDKDIGRFKYQKKIFAKLRQCTKHHADLKRCLKEICDLVKVSMPIFLILGVLGFIAILYNFLYTLESASTITKIRSVYVVVFCAAIIGMFSTAGQQISENTSLVFDTLTNCSWYLWDKRNKKVLLIFMANSLKPMTFSMYGITLDYQFALKVWNKSGDFVISEMF